MSDPLDLDRLAAASAAATPTEFGPVVCLRSRELVALVRRVRELEAERDALREKLRLAEMFLADPEQIVAHTDRVVTTGEAAREWDAMTRPPTREMIDLPPDLEDPSPEPRPPA